MGYNGSGVYTLPAGSIVSDGTSADASDLNTPLEDLEDSLNLVHLSDGRKAAEANWPMGGYKLTGLGSGSAATDSTTLAQAQNDVVAQATTVAGTVDAITLSFTPAISAYVTNMRIRWTSGGACTVTNPTVNVGGAGAKTIKKGASAALVAGDTGASGYICEAVYNGTDFILLNPADTGVKDVAQTFNAAATFNAGATFNSTVTFGTSASVVGGPLIAPSGRLTLTTATPVLTSDVSGATTVYFTPFRGNRFSLYNGTGWTVGTFTEVSQALSDTTKSPSATVANTLYDFFAWDDGGTFRVTRGPAWSSSTSRGTGAGTTELELLHGVYVNKIAITNGPAAQRGIYVGTIGTDAANQLNMHFTPAAAAGGSNNRIDSWNNYNRTDIFSLCLESTNSWNYTTNTFRAMNGSSSNRVTFVVGLKEDRASAQMNAIASNTSEELAVVGIGVDSTTAFSGRSFATATRAGASDFVGLSAAHSFVPGIGSHYVAPLEFSINNGTTTWYGDVGYSSIYQTGINLDWRC